MMKYAFVLFLIMISSAAGILFYAGKFPTSTEALNRIVTTLSSAEAWEAAIEEVKVTYNKTARSVYRDAPLFAVETTRTPEAMFLPPVAANEPVPEKRIRNEELLLSFPYKSEYVATEETLEGDSPRYRATLYRIEDLKSASSSAEKPRMVVEIHFKSPNTNLVSWLKANAVSKYAKASIEPVEVQVSRRKGLAYSWEDTFFGRTVALDGEDKVYLFMAQANRGDAQILEDMTIALTDTRANHRVEDVAPALDNAGSAQ